MLEVVEHDVEQVDVKHSEVRVVGREAAHHPRDVLADFELAGGWIVEEIAGDFVADAFAREEALASHSGKNLVEAFSE